MPRVRVSTTVDEQLLNSARESYPGSTDSAVIEAALEALLARRRSAEIDSAYSVYDEKPLSEPDEWGDLESFRSAAAAS